MSDVTLNLSISEGQTPYLWLTSQVKVCIHNQGWKQHSSGRPTISMRAVPRVHYHPYSLPWVLRPVPCIEIWNWMQVWSTEPPNDAPAIHGWSKSVHPEPSKLQNNTGSSGLGVTCGRDGFGQRKYVVVHVSKGKFVDEENLFSYAFL